MHDLCICVLNDNDGHGNDDNSDSLMDKQRDRADPRTSYNCANHFGDHIQHRSHEAHETFPSGQSSNHSLFAFLCK